MHLFYSIIHISIFKQYFFRCNCRGYFRSINTSSYHIVIEFLILYMLFNRNKVVRRQQEIWFRKYLYQWQHIIKSCAKLCTCPCTNGEGTWELTKSSWHTGIYTQIYVCAYPHHSVIWPSLTSILTTLHQNNLDFH